VLALVDDRDLASVVSSHKRMRQRLGSAAPALVSTSHTDMVDGDGMTYVPASVLKEITCFECLEDSLLDGKTFRKMDGRYSVSDGAAAVLFTDASHASRWAKNYNQVNVGIAPSLVYVNSGHSKVMLFVLMVFQLIIKYWFVSSIYS